jgi:hypothetical protein
MFFSSPELISLIKCKWTTVKDWVTSQRSFFRTEHVRWPCGEKFYDGEKKKKKAGGGVVVVGRQDCQPVWWHVKELENMCTVGEGICNNMTDDIFIIILRRG